jgi:hypothetical protein
MIPARDPALCLELGERVVCFLMTDHDWVELVRLKQTWPQSYRPYIVNTRPV